MGPSGPARSGRGKGHRRFDGPPIPRRNPRRGTTGPVRCLAGTAPTIWQGGGSGFRSAGGTDFERGDQPSGRWRQREREIQLWTQDESPVCTRRRARSCVSTAKHADNGQHQSWFARDARPSSRPFICSMTHLASDRGPDRRLDGCATTLRQRFCIRSGTRLTRAATRRLPRCAVAQRPHANGCLLDRPIEDRTIYLFGRWAADRRPTVPQVCRTRNAPGSSRRG